MKSKYILLVVAICAITALVSVECGIKGPPQAPVRKVPPVVKDLTATLRGASVRLSWTPSLTYQDGSELSLRKVSIYRLDDDFGEQLERMEKEEQERREEGGAGAQTLALRNEAPVGELGRLIAKSDRIPILDFRGRARLVVELSVEQMLDRVSGGKLWWQEPMPLQAIELSKKRAVYAVVETDARGSRSAVSNLAKVLPLPAPPGPSSLQTDVTQEELALRWVYPDRSDANSKLLTLNGFNVYRAEEGEAFGDFPANQSLLPTATATGWQALNVLSQQRIAGKTERYALLLTTNARRDSAGISQVLIPADRIQVYRGATIEVEAVMWAPGGESEGRLVLDAARDPSAPLEPAAGADVFKDEENPLIAIEKIKISPEPGTFRLSFRIPVDARALTLRVDPRGLEPVAAPFVVESVRALVRGSNESLVTNGDFDGFDDTAYEEKISSFGKSYDFRVTAVYSIGDYVFESEPGETVKLELVDTFAPEAPRNIRAVGGPDAITVSWNESRAPDVRGYLVMRREGSDGAWRTLTDRPLDSSVYRDTDVKPGVDYFYRVVAVDRAGNRSEFSREADARIAGN